MATPGAMHLGPQRRPELAAQRPRRPERGAPGLEGDGGSQQGVAVTRSDNRKRLADVQEHRGCGRVASRGLVRVRTEFALEVLVHNLLVLQRSSSQKQNVKETHPARKPIAA